MPGPLPLPRARLAALDGAQVRLLDGPFQRQTGQARDFYLNQLASDDILHGFRKQAGLDAPGKALGGWCSGTSAVVFGQWLSGLARLGRALGDQALLDKGALLAREWGRCLPTIGFGHYDYDKYVGGLVDLIAYGGVQEAAPLLAQLTRRAEERLGRDRLPASDEDSQGGYFNGQLEWYTLTENLYRAWLATGDERYRRFGEVWRYPHYWDMFTGKKPCEPWGYHGYSHCNALSSLALAYAVEGAADQLQGLIAGHDFFVKTQCYATGGYGPGEKLMRPDGELGRSLVEEPNVKWLKHQVGRSFETPCGSWAVFKLCSYLMQLTGEARYGDWLERILYNGLGASLPVCDDGRTFYYADYRLMGGSKVWHGSPLPCCSGTYIQCVGELPSVIAYQRPEGLDLNLYLPSEIRWQQDGVALRATVATRYPDEGRVAITLHLPKPVATSLRLRVPAWAAGMRASIGGANVPCPPGDWAVIARTWRDGEVVEVDIPLAPRAEAIDAQHPKRVAVLSGPLVLVRKHETLRLAPGALAAARPADLRLSVPSSSSFVPFWRVGFAEPYQMYLDLE